MTSNTRAEIRRMKREALDAERYKILEENQDDIERLQFFTRDLTIHETIAMLMLGQNGEQPVSPLRIIAVMDKIQEFTEKEKIGFGELTLAVLLFMDYAANESAKERSAKT